MTNAKLKLHIIERDGQVFLALLVDGQPVTVIPASQAQTFADRVQMAADEAARAQEELDERPAREVQ